jgi:hypothetical protein
LQPFFGKSTSGRQQYAANIVNITARSALIDFFAYRLFEVQTKREAFNEVFRRVVDPVPDWHIDQADSGQHYLKFQTNGLTHNSDGLGDGLVSLLFLIDALYDSTKGDIIAIDEPELSLHPSFQRRYANLLLEYSATRQIVVSTHSPYFLPLCSLPSGVQVARVYTDRDGSRIAQLSDKTIASLTPLLSDLNNPHILGLDAREVFFLDDGVILVEGQEDVVMYQRLASQLGLPFSGTFFGWGVGGADKMSAIVALLRDLSFKRVAGILDQNKDDVATFLTTTFPDYKFFVLPTDDVRSKPPREAKAEVSGLLRHDGTLRPEYADEARKLVEKVNAALAP